MGSIKLLLAVCLWVVFVNCQDDGLVSSSSFCRNLCRFGNPLGCTCLPPSNPCRYVYCRSGKRCVVNIRKGVCIRNRFRRCLRNNCGPGRLCIIESGGKMCIPDDPCYRRRCWKGQHCIRRGWRGVCISDERICQEPLKVGPCKAAIPRYYYNRTTGKCQRFSWGGCRPNLNNFATYSRCSTACDGFKG